MARREYDDDDGRVIADMSNVDVPGLPNLSRLKKRNLPQSPYGKVYLTKSESRAYTWGAIKAALLVVAIYGGVFGLLIYLMVKFLPN